jgi:hypothetical protein
MFECYVVLVPDGYKRTVLVSSHQRADEARRDARSATNVFHRARYAYVRAESGAGVFYLPNPDNYYDADPKTIKLRTLEPYPAAKAD